MKRIKKLGIAVFSVIALASCSEEFYDVNESQTNPDFSTPELSLPVAQKQTVDILSGGYNSMNTLGNLWTYAWAAGGDYVYFVDETTYNLTSSFRPTTFTTAYLSPMNNYDVVEKNTDPQYANYVAIAKIMKAFHFQYLVDIYGDVPYFDAFQRSNNTTPAYDSGQEIYDDLLVQLTAAQDLIAASNGNGDVILPTVTTDKMLAGNMAMWSKFANTLKLRILVRQSEIGATDYSSVNNGIGFLGAGETVFCNPGYVKDTGRQNPLWDAFGLTVADLPAANANATRATNYVITQLQSDPRRSRLFAPVVNSSNFVGIPQNNVGGPNSSTLSGIGPGVLKSATMPGIIMQSAESLLLQAEAAARGFIAGNAQALYEQAIAESFNQLGADVAQVPAYLSLSGAYPTSGLEDQVRAIITQKWIALMGTNGIESWIEYKRTGYPNVPVAPGEDSIPVRLLYPTSEVQINPNTPVQSPADAFTSTVFWDN